MAIDSGKPRSGRAGITILADEDVRRGLEQRALRNVRNLIDKFEDEQRRDDALESRVMFSGSRESEDPRPRKAGITVLADKDVRRGLEQRALRNTRSLVDKLEKEEQKDENLQYGVSVVFLTIVACVAVCLLFLNLGAGMGKPVQQFPRPGFSSQQESR